MKIAIFDIGTNSIHMLVVEVREDLSFKILGHEKDTTRLGDGSFETKMLSAFSMQRAFEVIERFYKIAQRSQIKRMVAVATSAVREARNGGEFVDAIAKKTGMKVQVITGEEEGRLIFLGAKSSVETDSENALVIDIGGGSAELILGNDKGILFLESFKLGVARLTDHFIHRDPPSKNEIRELENHIRHELQKAIKKIKKIGFSKVIGTAGTMINLASMAHVESESAPLRLVNHYEFKKRDLEKVCKKITRADLEERFHIPGLDPKRADIIVAGGVLVSRIVKMLGINQITLSDKAIREGIIIDYIEKNKKRFKAGDEKLSIRERSVLQLARRCSYDEKHAVQVARLALDFFDKTKPLHRLGDNERELLKFASLLHDIGYYVSFQKHHRHSYYLIVNSDLDGFTPQEVEIVGAVARYHRKQLPKKEDEHWARVGEDGEKTVKVLSAILRIADGLDRTHFAVVKSISCKLGRKRVKIIVYAKDDAELEMWQARQRADLFKVVFKREVVIELGKKRR